MIHTQKILSIPFVLVLCALAMPLAFAEEVVVEYDVPSPSGGSGWPFVPPETRTATVNVDLSNQPAPPASSIPETPGPLTPAASLTFTGVTELPRLDGFLLKPPDTHVAVGTGAGAAGRVVMVTNTGIEIYDKTGSVVAARDDLEAFLTGLGATLTVSAPAGFDPKVIFDQHSSRFFVVILEGKTAAASIVHICTSKTATPGTITSTDWTVESASAVTAFVNGSTWFDYPGIGADATRLVITGNMFTTAGAFVGQKIRVFLKSSLTDDGTPSGSTFTDIDTDATVVSGISTVQPAHVFGSTLNGDFYLINRFGSTLYRMWQVTGVGGSTAALAAGSPTLVGWTAGAFISTGAPQTNDGLNDEPTISTLSPRVQNAVYRNDAGNTDSIWLCLSADIDSDSQTEVVWFEIDPNVTNSAVAGTLTSSTTNSSGFIDGATAGDWTYMPSISVNGSGDVCINYCLSNAGIAVTMRATTRHVTDATGTFQPPVTIATGAGEYDDFFFSNLERWGDYAATVIDPDDDETFWIANEVCQTAATVVGDDGRWGTRIAKLGPVISDSIFVTSITRQAPSGQDTNATQVTFAVTFNRSVVGVATNNFSIDATGTQTAASVNSVGGSGQNWTVTVDTAAGVGSLSIDLDLNLSNITDGGSLTLSTSFTGGETYNVDRSAPTADTITPSTTGPTNASSVDFTVVFNESVSNFDAASDLVITHTGTANSGVSFSGSGDTYTVSVTGISGDGSFTLKVDTASDVMDSVGNALTSSVTSSAVNIDNTAPTVGIGAPSATDTNTGPVTFLVTYTGSSSVNLTPGDISLNATGTSASIGVTDGTTSTPTVTLSSITGDGTLGISLGAATSSDALGNSDVGAGPSTTFNVDNTPPVVTVDTLTTSDSTPQLTGTVDDASASISVTVSGQTNAATNNGATWTLADGTLSTLLPGTYDVQVTATDPAGNEGSDATTDELTVEFSGEIVFVNFDTGRPGGTGEEGDPVDTVSTALGIVQLGGIIRIDPGSSSETPTISQEVTLERNGVSGTVTIGAPPARSGFVSSPRASSSREIGRYESRGGKKPRKTRGGGL